MSPALPRRPILRPLALLTGLATAAVLSGCGTAVDPGARTGGASPSTATTATTPTTADGPAEAAAVTPRLAVTYDGGVQVLDAASLELIADLPLPGFNRLNPAGDGRHVLVSTEGGFRVLDTGTWGSSHGDHAHYHTSAPALTDLTYAAEEPGHVVPHHGRTALFDDGAGRVTVVDSDKIADPAAPRREYTTPQPHHGVALELADRRLVVSEGTAEARTGIRVLSADDREIEESTQCPGVHGEATAQDETVVIGCTDGVLVYRSDTITKVDSADDYGRIGNQAGSDVSPIVLGDYKVDEDADLERPTQVSLIDTEQAKLRLVQLPSSYTFRSLGRGPKGEALVLGTDGKLHVIDQVSGKITDSVPLMRSWTEPDAWQSPRPTLKVSGDIAYVSDPASSSIMAVDLIKGVVIKKATLSAAPNEVAVATGTVADHD
ncbi:MAG TPA: zinc metallochaperone AztD [Microlunatus sp.]